MFHLFPYEGIDIVSHAAQCRVKHCEYPRCRQVCWLLLHGSRCQVRVPGGCVFCKTMWILLYHHALPCKEDECYVPRCRDIKDDMQKKLQAEIRSKAAASTGCARSLIERQ